MVVGFFQPREREGARDEEAGGWVRGRGGLVWVQRTAVVFGGAELVASEGGKGVSDVCRKVGEGLKGGDRRGRQ